MHWSQTVTTTGVVSTGIVGWDSNRIECLLSTYPCETRNHAPVMALVLSSVLPAEREPSMVAYRRDGGSLGLESGFLYRMARVPGPSYFPHLKHAK